MSSLMAPSVGTAQENVGPVPVADHLRSSLDALAGRDAFGWISLPAPVRPVETLIALGDQVANGSGSADSVLTDRADAVVWDPPRGVSMAGVGTAWKLQLKGKGRFQELRNTAGRLLRDLLHLPAPGALDMKPRLLGGFAFDVGAADQEPWRDLGDGCFTLPRFVYAVDRERDLAMLALVAHGSELETEARRGAWRAEAEALIGRLNDSPLRTEAESHGGRPEADEDVEAALEDADWIRRVDDIRRAIHAGEVEKIVAARRCEVPIASPLRSSEVLARLGRDLRASTRFAFCRPGGSFVGVTPERLLAKEGRRIQTEALAGSIERGQGPQLLDSGKDRLEQQLVVDSIVRRLDPLCDRLQVAARPTIRELRDVLHLHTPIVGTLRSPCHILDLVERLHPTPAVGGVPTPAAVSWITERETHARGWYAAPIGWFDGDGDGEFAVALRSCILTDETAYLFVGAGIVEDSDPELELRETELKKQALLSALRD